ncbi:hypothetical protein C817_02446 [Dorea sp. 5-2]|nr:hypothetical protein C817_02446 [Dorea sp. 5-2]
MLIPERENFKGNPSLYKEMTEQGLSMGVMSCLISAGSVILQSGINGLGYLYIAAHTAARRLMSPHCLHLPGPFHNPSFQKNPLTEDPSYHHPDSKYSHWLP